MIEAGGWRLEGGGTNVEGKRFKREWEGRKGADLDASELERTSVVYRICSNQERK